MNSISRFGLLVVLFFFSAAAVYALPVKRCYQCSYDAMVSMAKAETTHGSVIVIDPANYTSYKFRVFRTFEPGFNSTLVIPKPLSTKDQELVDLLYQYYDAAGPAQKQVFFRDLGQVEEFRGFTAYDIKRSSRNRNAMADYIRNNLTTLMQGGYDLKSNNEVMAKAVEIILQVAIDFLEYEIDMTLEFNVKLQDGSLVVFDVDLSNGRYPEFNLDRSRDADGNSLVGSTGWNEPDSEYTFSRWDTLNDFSRAVEAYGVPVYYVPGVSRATTGGSCRTYVQDATTVVVCQKK